jgi:hypothetical protein
VPDSEAAEWNRNQFKTWARAAQKLLAAFKGDAAEAGAYLASKAKSLEDKGLSWNLATIARHAWDDKGRGAATAATDSDNEAFRRADELVSRREA